MIRSTNESMVRCLEGDGSDDLTAGQVYKVLPDAKAFRHGYLRVIDDSGEDYLHAARRFEPVSQQRTKDGGKAPEGADILVVAPSGEVLLLIQAKAKSSRNALTGVHAGRLKVNVTAAPEKGKANAAVLSVIASSLALKPSQVSLAAGETDPRKTVLITGVTADDLRERIAAALTE